MSTVLSTTWTDDGRTLTIERQVEGGILTTSHTWLEPPSDDIVALALASQPQMVREPGAGHRAWRKPFGGRFAVYAHHDFGPPRWTFPKVKPELNRRRISLAVGWLYHCYAISLSWSERDA